jgi:hypothetical protein
MEQPSGGGTPLARLLWSIRRSSSPKLESDLQALLSRQAAQHENRDCASAHQRPAQRLTSIPRSARSSALSNSTLRTSTGATARLLNEEHLPSIRLAASDRASTAGRQGSVEGGQAHGPPR